MEVDINLVEDIKTEPVEIIAISDTEASPVKTDVVSPPSSSLMMKNDPDVQPYPLQSFTVLKTSMGGHPAPQHAACTRSPRRYSNKI